jgi:hypothetical protein
MATQQPAPVQFGNISGLTESAGRNSRWTAREALGGMLGRCEAYTAVHSRLCRSVDIPRKKWLFRRLNRWNVVVSKAEAALRDTVFKCFEDENEPRYSVAGIPRGRFDLTGARTGRLRNG